MSQKWFGVITIFPEMFKAISEWGITKQALKAGLYELETFNLRDYTTDKHRTVDDRPFGGGPGMLMKIEPLERALEAAKARAASKGKAVKVIFLSPQGQVFQHQASVDLAQAEDNYIFICGRYEGIDQRFIDRYVDQEWSLGDFVLTGGELGAMTMIDAIIRHLPQALNTKESAEQDSFANGLLDCPHYTRPEVYHGEGVPEVLMSGHHAKIELWRQEQSLRRTLERRPELVARLEEQGQLSKTQVSLLAQIRGLPDPYAKRKRKKAKEPTSN
ncbi:tRNA (guanosine(37)-N1)-methyltransferase TrmD [Psittacicella gerlachiana]|uniref:tRNA (guanine-N(1)-)-methyltransferase n=1 Tax=Psittacicella gerlachiana TaxID=2028574 RepID=A0A3A1YK24_9GAMM|nr:tRNA (guanosine(37)-N1)-methyltransferase TrmD [Psittacicella gerlachiana]RIY38532.1 tRNA (guanosine(37)-N1)-methyltransferase TrmD [Psittacicella gerlachiana]